MNNKIPVAVLAATGSVGQRFISLLNDHPWFQVVEITASDRSVGKTYAEACPWLLPDPMPEYAKRMIVLPTEAAALKNAKIVFSALPADVAAHVEPAIAEKGMFVCSNAAAYRKDALVPVLIPEVNPDHLDIIDQQKTAYGWKGGIITNPNCTTVALVPALKAIDTQFSLTKAVMFSMQAISGAGYPGVPSMDIVDNVVPYIGGEEEKVEYEALKILGKYSENKIALHPLILSAHTNRVAVVDGHTLCVSFGVEKQCDVKDIVSCLENFKTPEIVADLPSCPKKSLTVYHEDNRPQPKLDRNKYNGMGSHVGRIRADRLLGFKMVMMAHNTIKGAAGGSIFNAELLAKTRLF